MPEGVLLVSLSSIALRLATVAALYRPQADAAADLPLCTAALLLRRVSISATEAPKLLGLVLGQRIRPSAFSDPLHAQPTELRGRHGGRI